LSSKNPGELMVEEYKSLRRELLQLAASISRWHVTGFVAAGIAIALALLSSGWVVAASALPVIAGCLFGIIHDLTSILRIAAYIQVFHEGHDTLALWETRLEGIRGANVFVPLRPYMTPILSLLWIGLLCALIAGLLPFTIPVFGSRPYWLLSIPVAWIIFWLVLRRSYRAFDAGGFKDQTKNAFYDNLRRPGGNA